MIHLTPIWAAVGFGVFADRFCRWWTRREQRRRPDVDLDGYWRRHGDDMPRKENG